MASRRFEQRTTTVAVVGFMLLAADVRVFAQHAQRAHLSGIGGVIVAPEASIVYAGEVGINVRPEVELVAEAARMRNVVPASLRRLATEQSSDLFDVVTVRPSAPITYAAGGIKVLPTPRNRVRPYVAATIGYASIAPAIEVGLGNSDVMLPIPLGTRVTLPHQNGSAVGLRAGLDISVTRHVVLSPGYQHVHVFAGEGVNVGQATIGLGWVFH